MKVMHLLVQVCAPEHSPGEPFLACYCLPVKPRLSFTYSVKPTVIHVSLFFVQSPRLFGIPRTAACRLPYLSLPELAQTHVH